MKIIDNFLEKENFLELEKAFFGTEFPWYYNDSKSLKGDVNFQFIHAIVWDKTILSPYWKIVEPILKKLNYKEVIRVKANLTTKKNEIIKSPMHIDTGVKNSKTAVFYCNTNNGYTLFNSGEKVVSKANRAVVFEGNEFHCGVDSTDEKIRVVINFNYFEK